jgi:lysophospholipase L1-like esterase
VRSLLFLEKVKEDSFWSACVPGLLANYSAYPQSRSKVTAASNETVTGSILLRQFFHSWISKSGYTPILFLSGFHLNKDGADAIRRKLVGHR